MNGKHTLSFTSTMPYGNSSNLSLTMFCEDIERKALSHPFRISNWKQDVIYSLEKKIDISMNYRMDIESLSTRISQANLSAWCVYHILIKAEKEGEDSWHLEKKLLLSLEALSANAKKSKR